jgi:hypothetical protein
MMSGLTHNEPALIYFNGWQCPVCAEDDE